LRSSRPASFRPPTQPQISRPPFRRPPKCFGPCNFSKISTSDSVIHRTKPRWFAPENERIYMKLKKTIMMATLVAGGLLAGIPLQAQDTPKDKPAGEQPPAATAP